jgi:hypothetical protein
MASSAPSPPANVTLTVSYDDDLDGGSDTLLAVLPGRRPSSTPSAQRAAGAAEAIVARTDSTEMVDEEWSNAVSGVEMASAP